MTNKWKERAVDIATVSGRAHLVQAKVLGQWAAHHSLNHLGSFMVTHVPTGMAIPYPFDTENEARTFIVVLIEKGITIDRDRWQDVTKDDIKASKMALLECIPESANRWRYGMPPKLEATP